MTLPGHALCVRMETSPEPQKECARCEGQIRTPSLLSEWLTRLVELKRLLGLGVRVDLAQLAPEEARGLLVLEEEIEAWRQRQKEKETREGKR